IPEEHGSLYLDLVHSQIGAHTHQNIAFVRTAISLGIKARIVKSDIHTFAEVYIPSEGAGWLRIDLGGWSDPMKMDLRPLAHVRHTPFHNDNLPQPAQYQESYQKKEQRLVEALNHQGIRPQISNRSVSSSNPYSTRENEDGRIAKEFNQFIQELSSDRELNDPLATMLHSGTEDTESVFLRILRLLPAKMREVEKRAVSGLKMDRLAFMLRRPMGFVVEKKLPNLRKSAVGILVDASTSQKRIKQELDFTVAAVGTNFRKLKEESRKNFFYDLSYFTDQVYPPIVGFDETVTEEENRERLVDMANQIPSGGTDILEAMRQKLKDFLQSPGARKATIKYLIVLTDGDDEKAIIRGRATPEFKALLDLYREAGIDLVFIGIGPGAKDVEALCEPGQHYVKIKDNRPMDIAEAIAKVVEFKLLGDGVLRQGDITDFLRIGPVKSRVKSDNVSGTHNPVPGLIASVLFFLALGFLPGFAKPLLAAPLTHPSTSWRDLTLQTQNEILESVSNPTDAIQIVKRVSARILEGAKSPVSQEDEIEFVSRCLGDSASQPSMRPNPMVLVVPADQVDSNVAALKMVLESVQSSERKVEILFVGNEEFQPVWNGFEHVKATKVTLPKRNGKFDFHELMESQDLSGYSVVVFGREESWSFANVKREVLEVILRLQGDKLSKQTLSLLEEDKETIKVISSYQ
ncbi:MAG: VWA domain-containing protein, partial [Elusimicrobia bacterium]|nr:VWA domain-containing protein [Elusimicrobiota bacterium]